MSWFGINVTYIRFYAGMKAQGMDRKTLPFMSVLQPYAAWYAAFMCLLICFVSNVSVLIVKSPGLRQSSSVQLSGWAVFLRGSWVTATFVTDYLPLALFPALYVGAKLWKRTPIVRASDMDFVTNIREIEADTFDEPPPRNKWEAFWQWLVRVSFEVLSQIQLTFVWQM